MSIQLKLFKLVQTEVCFLTRPQTPAVRVERCFVDERDLQNEKETVISVVIIPSARYISQFPYFLLDYPSILNV